MSQKSPTLEGLATSIAELTKTLVSQLKDANEPEPSFGSDAPPSLPPTPEIQGVRMQLIGDLTNLLHLTTGPREYIIQQSMFNNNESLTLDVLNRFDFWHAVPLSGSASYAEIAAETNLPEQLVRRFLRVAMAIFFFREESPGSDRIVHSAASAQIVREPVLGSFIGHSMEELRPAAAVGVDALEKFFVGSKTPSEEKEHCAAYLASVNGKVLNKSFWEFLKTDERPGKPKGFRATRFSEAMQSINLSMVGSEVVLEKFDWESLGEGTVIDLGGSSGQISAIVAKVHPKLKMIVQDLPEVEGAFNEFIGVSDLASRISFQPYDFLTPQSVSADAYLIKSVLHDWSDKYVVQILQNQLAAMKPGAHVVLFDIILPPDVDESGNAVVPPHVRRFLGNVDLQMFIALNAKERTVEDWTSVFKRADARFEIEGVHAVPGAPLGIIDFVLKGEELVAL